MKEELTNKLKRARGLNKERFIRLESIFDTLKNPPVDIEMTKVIISEIGMLNEKILDLFEGMIYLFELVSTPDLGLADSTNLELVDTTNLGPNIEPVDVPNLEPKPNEKLFQKMKAIAEKEPEGYT